MRNTHHYTHSKGKRGSDIYYVSILFRIIHYVPEGFSIHLTFILLFLGKAYLREYSQIVGNQKLSLYIKYIYIKP